MFGVIRRVLRGRRFGVLALCVFAIGLLVFALQLYQPRLAIRALAHMLPSVVVHAETTEPIIALTFDDGPNPVFTPQLLRVLASRRVKATFFLIGSRARAYPEVVRQIRADGHQIANHMMTTRRAILMSAREADASLLEAERVLGLDRGSPKWVRPPAGVFRPSFLDVASRRGYRVVLGSAYAADPYRPPARYLAWALTRMCRPGSIIVLHDGGGDRSRSIGAVPPIVDTLRSRGFRFVTLDELVPPRR